MELTNEFRVDRPVDETWNVLTDVERIAPALPGAQLQEIEGDEYRGIVKVKVGPITAQYKGKAKLLQPNLDAFMMGLHHGREYFDDALGLRIERRDAVGKRIFIEGNAAAALGCVYGGATVCAWYPITPSSSLAEAFQKYCGKLCVDKATGQNKFAIVQAEDELARIADPGLHVFMANSMVLEGGAVFQEIRDAATAGWIQALLQG